MARRKRKPPNVRIEDDDGDDNKRRNRRLANDGPKTKSPPSYQSSDTSIYTMPPLYDLAFGYRNYDEEVESLLHMHVKHSHSEGSSSLDGNGGLRLLELAAGPARHSLSALTCHPKTTVHSVLALDSSRTMVDYGIQNADVDLVNGGGRRDDFEYVCGDMRYVRDCCPTTKRGGELLFDSAWLLLGSMQHLLTNDDVITFFSSLHSVMKSGATVVIELPHPREIFGMGECTTNGWTVPLVDEEGHGAMNNGDDGKGREYGQLNIVWGEEGDAFDPVSQIRHFSIGFELTVNDINDVPQNDDTSILFSQNNMMSDGKINVREVVPLRMFTLQEIGALAQCAGFEIVAKYGALSENVSIDDEDEAFRMVCVLRRKNKD